MANPEPSSTKQERLSRQLLRVLMVEDSPDDAELIELELTNGGYQIEALRVVSAADMATALNSADWDVIIADYSVPGFGAVPSLKLLRESGRDIPFIIVTGSISDEMAVASMRAGAHDYVLKDNLLRLVPAVEREIKESAARHQKHEAEAALHESQSRLNGIVQSAMDSIISVDEEQRIVLFNEAAERLFGCPSSEALGSSLDRFIPPNYRDVHRDHIRMFGMSGMTTRSMYSPGVLTALRTSGEEFPIEATISQIEAAGRKYFTVILRDISERKRAEAENSRLQAQLAQSQKLEAIGQLAGGVAHDFNTLLNIILGYSDLLLADLPEGDPRRERVKQIQTSGETGALLTKQLLAFSRRRALVPQVIDLSTTVGDLEPMLRRLLREDIELEVHRAEQACPVKVDPGQIQQLVLNLAANARDAMPRGGNLTIEVRTVELDESYVHQHPSMTPGKYEMLAVSDTGVGMDAEIAAHIFEPFFTTKSTGQGTGLGLSTVYGIAKQSGGDIWVYSEPGVGSCFKVHLPRSSEPHAERSTQQQPKKLTGSETILLVEDSKSLRELTRELLAHGGYSVLEAKDGVEALEVSKQYEGTIHLLMTDIIMPKMRGTEVAIQFAKQRPNTAVIFLSGYTEEAISHIPGARRIAILEKPYTADSLLRTARQTLDHMQIAA